MKRFALGSALFLVCAFAPVSNATVTSSMRNNAAVATANSHGISDNLRTFILDLDQAQTPGNYSVQLGKATLSSPVPGDSQGFAAGKKLPFRPDPFIGIAIIAAFAMIGSSLRRQKTRETGPNL